MGKVIVFRGARLLDPATGRDEIGDLVVNGTEIVEIGPDVSSKYNKIKETIDAGNAGKPMCLAPGLVDMRAHLGEPGDEHKETIESASAAALSGGITSIICLPDTDPVIDDVAGVEYIARRAREVKGVKVFPYAAATRELAGEQMTEFGLLSEMGAVAFTDGRRAIADAKMMSRALAYAKTFNLLIVQHPEEPSLAENGVATSGEIATRLGLPGIPPVAEVMMIERDLRLVEMTGGRYHAAHVSTAAAVEAIRQAKARGLPVTCDTAPAYFALTEADIGDYRTFARVSPPLRAEADRRAVVEGLSDGTIDAIASDHLPHDQDSKRVPFVQAEPGIVGLETLLPLTLELVHNGHLGMLDAIARMTTGPADILGLPMGRLAEGAPADLVLFDPDTPWRIDVDAFLGKSKNSPFDERPVQGRAVRTMVGGRTLFKYDG